MIFMGLNNISNDFLFPKKKDIDDIYINFQSNDRFYKIRIYYNNFHKLCTVKDLVESFALDIHSR
jgi:hypothetical protein